MTRAGEPTGGARFKIVFCGPGQGGKTTALLFVARSLPAQRRGDLVSLSTETDRTLFFDFLPLQLGRVEGLGGPASLHLYTVPGQVFYEEARTLVLKGADGIVFVADSREERQEANRQALRGLEASLAVWGMDLSQMPLTFLYNRRDQPGRVPIDRLREALNPRGRPEFEAVATEGRGVLEMLDAVCELVVERYRSRR